MGVQVPLGHNPFAHGVMPLALRLTLPRRAERRIGVAQGQLRSGGQPVQIYWFCAWERISFLVPQIQGELPAKSDLRRGRRAGGRIAKIGWD